MCHPLSACAYTRNDGTLIEKIGWIDGKSPHCIVAPLNMISTNVHGFLSHWSIQMVTSGLFVTSILASHMEFLYRKLKHNFETPMTPISLFKIAYSIILKLDLAISNWGHGPSFFTRQWHGIRKHPNNLYLHLRHTNFLAAPSHTLSASAPQSQHASLACLASHGCTVFLVLLYGSAACLHHQPSSWCTVKWNQR